MTTTTTTGTGWVQAARQVLARNEFQMVGQDGTVHATVWDGDEVSEASEGMILDLFSASAMIQVHDALSGANQARFAAMSLTTAHAVAFRLIAKQNGESK
jgi:hypothetical protein